MSSLLFGTIGSHPVPQDEQTVRMTTAPVIPDAPPAMADAAPDFNEVETDPNPTLGMSTRQLASTWHQGEKFSPSWIGNVDAADEHNAIIDRQVSSSGTAAQRESAGVFGHGSMSFAEGIEPTIRDGGAFGNEYFVAERKGIQSTAGDYMTTPPGTDQHTTASLAALAKDAARDSTQYSAYRNMWNGIQNGT